MITARQKSRRTLDIWPGFVDAMATLLMVIIFLLLVFVLAQFVLTRALSARDQALSRLERQVGDLVAQLSLEKGKAEKFRLELGEVKATLSDTNAIKNELEAKYTDALKLSEANGAELAVLRQKAGEFEIKAQALTSELTDKSEKLAQESKVSLEAQAQVALLNQQLKALKDQLISLNALLETSEKQMKEQKVEIVNLGQRLNAALASKVEELSRYRSEFFGRLRESLGKTPGIRIEGDRFVFQSEVLFPLGSSDMESKGQEQIIKLAESLKEISAKIPTDIPWVLRIDGHTDKLPIKTAKFASNWELSMARAMSVLRILTNQGIAPERLAAAGFAEYQPLDKNDSDEARKRNRRIELKFDRK